MKMPLKKRKKVVVGTKNRKLETVNKRQKHVGGSNQKEQERKQRHKQEERIEIKEQNLGADQGEQKEHKMGKHINSAHPNSHGQGLPFAPENWPEPGDIWRWSTGERAPTGKKDSEELGTHEDDYVEEVPNVACSNKEADEVDDSSIKELAGYPMAVENKNVDDSIWCKIGNINCTLLDAYRRSRSLPKTKTCEMCCVEPGFCGECCCLLCGKIIDQLSTDYTFIRCEQKIGEDLICGHVAHLECALGCATAGVLKKIQLDAEYYCRRCDKKTDLVMHVQLLIQRSMSLQESSKVQKNLQLALHIIRGTHREGRDLQLPLEMALNKIHSGVKLQDISELKDLTAIVHKMLGGSGKHFVYQSKASENVQGKAYEGPLSNIMRAIRTNSKTLCKVGNKCCSLLNGKMGSIKPATCDICCTEPGFCGVCCCILCGKVTNQNPEECNSIRCENKVDQESICGHVAHLECALMSSMSGVLDKIGLDVEYLCRRCDMKSDLMMHVALLVQKCQFLDEPSEVQKNLKLALDTVKGTHKNGLRRLENGLIAALAKISSGTNLEDVAELGEIMTLVNKV